MRRRTLLSGVGVAATIATTGCTARVFGSESNGTVLGPQEDQIADSEDLAYPAYGQSLPAFELSDPIGGQTIDTDELERTAIVTGIFTFCPAECSVLLRRLVTIQSQVGENGLNDETVFLPVTFDPNRDDEEQLRHNAETIGVNLNAGNWHYLRPKSPERAKDVLEDKLGISFERTTEESRVAGYDFIHNVVTILVNPDGIVERAYRGEQLDRNRVTGDIQRVVDAFSDE